ncbi:hypothetical protein V9N49_000970 [Vibrio cholerae]|nr:hypothetical protein [Vibrio cholerae]
MRKLPTLIRHATHLFLIATLTWAIDAQSVEIRLQTDGSGYYFLEGLSFSFSDLNDTMTLDTDWGDLRWSVTSIEIRLKNDLIYWVSCDTPQNTVGVGQEIKLLDKHDPIRQRYLQQATNDLNNCVWSPLSVNSAPISDDFSVSYIRLYYIDQNDYWDKTSGAFFKNLNGFVVGHTTSCQATIKDHIRFGKLTPQENTQAQGTISVQCDSDASINVSVNKGKPLKTSEGAKIAFVYDSSLHVLGAKPIDVIITADMNQTPSQPGSYQWAVPVKITYE